MCYIDSRLKAFCAVIVVFSCTNSISCSTLDIYKNARLGHRIVQTKYGRLHGLILPLDNFRFLRSVEAFLGVPYATPPVKQNRFGPTRAPTPWDGIRISDKYSPVCPQRLPNIQNETAALEKMPKGRLEYLKRLLPFLQNQSEDCLYLNIFSPVHAANLEKKLPVIVFLHGESFEWSSGNPYDGSVLASYGEVVVVTLNYRLGILGFLNANPSPQIRARVANYGLMDQMAALHWVQQNIQKFGGDSNSVTLAGHGTGAACINFLMTSPTMVPGLFHRAILLSGSAYSSWALVEDPVIYALKLAREVNCTVPEDLIKHHEQIVDCLREVSLEDLYGVDIQPPNFLTSFGPSVDGVVIHPGHSNFDIDEVIKRNVKRPPENSGWRYDVLFGVVTGEAIWRFSAHDIQNGFEGERRDRIIRTFVRNAYTYHLNEIFYTIVNEYTDWDRTSQHPINTRDTAVAALSDAQFVAPIIRTGDILAPPATPAGQDKSGPRCYFYVFDYQTKDGDYPQRMGTVHGEDLPYIFGAPLVDGFSHFPSNYTKSEVALSEAIMIYWANFARTGNPNEHHRQDSILPASKERNRFRSMLWDEYDSLHQKYLEIGMKPRLKNHFRAHQLSIWLRLIPELHRTGMEAESTRHNMLKSHNDLTMYDGIVKPDSYNSRLPKFEDAIFKKNKVNSSEYITGVISGITTAEPISFTTCIPLSGNYTVFAPTNIVNATTDTLSGFEAAGYAAYSTALSVTIAIGCSLLILNVLIFAGVYYQRDKTRLEVKTLQKQYQQRTMHQQVQFDPIKHAHYHIGHSQSANVIVDVENHDQRAIILSGDIKSPHICPKTMQINTSCGAMQTKIPISAESGGGGVLTATSCASSGGGGVMKGLTSSYGNSQQPQPSREHVQMKGTQTFGRNTNNGEDNQNSNANPSGNSSFNVGMMTLPKSGTMHHSNSINYGRSSGGMNVGNGNGINSDCMTLPRSLASSHHSPSSGNPDIQYQQTTKGQPNGSIMGVHHIRAPRPPIRTASSSTVVSPQDQVGHHNAPQSNMTIGKCQQTENIGMTRSSSYMHQQVPKAAMDEMRV